MQSVNPTRVRFPITQQLATGEPIDWREVEVKVEGPSQIGDLAIDEADQVYISFTAYVVGNYKCIITHADRNLKNTPITINVQPKTADGPPPPEPTLPAAQAPTYRSIRFKVPYTNSDFSFAVSVIEGPDMYPLKTEAIREGPEISICLDLTKPGAYKIEVRDSHGPIPNSPFSMNVPPAAFNPK